MSYFQSNGNEKYCILCSDSCRSKPAILLKEYSAVASVYFPNNKIPFKSTLCN